MRYSRLCRRLRESAVAPGGAFALPSVTHTLRFPVLRTAAEIGCFRYPWVSLSFTLGYCLG